MPSADTIILDTHVWLDIAFGRGRIATRIMRKVDAAATDGALYIAAISCWEVAMLVQGGKVRVNGPVIQWLTRTLHVTRTAVAAFEPAIAVDAVELPAWDHRDPANRIIVATARHLGGLLVTRDSGILAYAGSARAVQAVEP